MQVPPERLLTEENLKHLGSLFAECVKEAYKDNLPKAKFTVYMRTPKYDGNGNESTAIMYEVSDDSVDGETLQNYIDRYHEPLKQCFLDRVSPNKDRDPDRDWVGYDGRVLKIGDEQPTISEGQPSVGNELTGDITIDNSQWIEIVKFAQRNNRYSKIKIIKGRVADIIITLSASETWEHLKPHLIKGIESGNTHLTELLEKIHDLPIEEILEKIREILPELLI